MYFKKENGSITIFVLIAMLFMTTFLIISYGSNVNNSKIVKEQFNMISETYMPNANIIESYTEAYTDLRAKKKDILKKTVEYESKLEIEKCYAEDIINYQIYGNEFGFGKEITEEEDVNYGKYEITIKIIDIKDEDILEDTVYQEKIYNIYLDNPLGYGQYIDYKTSRIYNEITEEEIETVMDLPKLITYEDYTNIKIYEGEEINQSNNPQKIIIEYVGYTFEEEE